ncbi:MAG: hypothetical protein OXU61_03735 [Gammaproteobacteria bacterium]|nr:hypothetical protein [Gammaproteobacteria bacterium]
MTAAAPPPPGVGRSLASASRNPVNDSSCIRSPPAISPKPHVCETDVETHILYGEPPRKATARPFYMQPRRPRADRDAPFWR